MEVPRNRVELRDDPGVLSHPLVTQPYGCATSVNVTAYVPRALLDLEIDGVQVVTLFPGGSPAPFGALIPVPGPLTPGQAVRARQHRGSAISTWSPPVLVRDHKVDFPAGLPRPELFGTPLYQCGARTGVNNLLVGCNVHVTQDSATVGSATGANNPQGINVAPAFDVGKHVRAMADLCGDQSPPSIEQTVQPPPLPLPAPGFDPYPDGATDIVNNTIVNGAKVTLSRNGVLVGTYPCWGGSCKINVSAVAITDSLSATQELCPSDGPSPAGTSRPQPCSSFPAPQVGPIQAGDALVVVTQFSLGSEIKVFVNGFKTGDGSGPVVPLIVPIPPGATVDVWQIVGNCQGGTVQQIGVPCVAPPAWGDPSYLDLFPVGVHEYDGGQTTIDGFTYDVRGSVYYPADDDGTDQPFNGRLASTGRVPLVVCVHGAHSPDTPSYKGYDYFQYQLARMGFIAVSVDERQNDLQNDWSGGTQNVVRRAELAIRSIAHAQSLDAGGPIFQGRIDFARTGLMGHSRGGDAVVAIPERISLPGVVIKAVLALAPLNSGANSGHPKNYAFMTFLPAADGDLIDNPGARYYDRADPGPIKVQLYIDHANHNYFNRQWVNDDAKGTLPLMSRPDHERVLSTYGCALFRSILRGDATFGYLDRHQLPTGVLNDNIHLSYEVAGTRVVDNYEGHPIAVDNEGAPASGIGSAVAAIFPFAQTAGAFNGSFFGDTRGNVIVVRDGAGQFREALKTPADLTKAEVRVRAAEVVQGTPLPPQATGFRVGVEDGAGMIAWVDVDGVGGLPRPFDRSALDTLTKTMLTTFRFPGSCFAAAAGQLRLSEIRAIHLGLNRNDRRPIAFDDLEIVTV